MPRIWSCLVIVCLFAGAVSAERPGQQILADMLAADAARVSAAAELAAWKREQQAMQQVLLGLQGEIQRLSAEVAGLTDRRQAQAAALAVVRAAQAEAKAVDERVSAVSARIRAGLATLHAKVPPGLIDLSEPGDQDAESVLLSALAALTAAEQASTAIAVHIVGGTLAGEERAVRLLRLGGVAAWWRSLDGQEAGTARMHNGRLVLELAEGEIAQSIAAAVAMAEGTRATQLLRLPFEHARQETP